MKTALLLRQSRTILAKDLRREWRTREILTTTVAFSVLLMAVFTFAFYRNGESTAEVFPGILWISIVFTGTLAIGRSFQHETQTGCLRALALVPGSQISLYLGKLAANLIFMLLFELALIPLLLLAFSVSPGPTWGLHLASILVGTAGFAILGTLVSAMLVKNDLREVLLPVLLYPLLIPLLIAGVKISAALLTGGAWEQVGGWLKAMVAMDLAYGVLCVLLFRFVLSAVE
ncbi:hypothetical protein DL240_00945 [Lujinxingia litoralis]|uniref:Heme exporter protein B n=1 Tax=Lujinxingia litoralis TaxID=2211119 RepID=A0A328CD50_9DELT|nr:heme exporter protein CcmB [Lujinxingia litoralis]RAL24809.1 hypothetical protein DL240_00945 [Lujinxingia litoralis]